jgi:hypothetical protein
VKMSADAEDHAVFVAEIATDVLHELEGRFPMDALPDRDTLAIATAVSKGAWRGFLRGVASASHEFNEVLAEQLIPELRRRLPPGVELPPVLVDTRFASPEGADIGPEPDAWIETYGAGE